MSERPFSVGPTAAATLLIAGLLALMFPLYAPRIVRVVLLTFAALGGLYALSVAAPAGSVAGRWSSPFDRAPTDSSGEAGSAELETLRARLSARRVVVPGTGPLPPETLRMLQRLVEDALRRAGMDPDDEIGRSLARERLHPRTGSLLEADPPTAPGWTQRRWPAPGRVARLVGEVLDDLDRLDPPASRSPSTPHPGAP